MKLKRPKTRTNDGLETIESPDSVDDLLVWVSSTTWVGRMIGDLYLSYKKGYFTDWISLQEADDLMPYFHGKKTQKQVGYRFWWLSRHKTPTNLRRKVYNGCWLDKRVVKSGGREYIRLIKLSDKAIECFKSREEIFEELYF